MIRNVYNTYLMKPIHAIAIKTTYILLLSCMCICSVEIDFLFHYFSLAYSIRRYQIDGRIMTLIEEIVVVFIYN